MNAATLVSLLLEAPPNVEERYQTLARELTRLYQQANGNWEQASRLIYHNPALHPFVDIEYGTQHGGVYCDEDRQIHLYYKKPDEPLADKLQTLRHELVHAAQHERRGYRSLITKRVTRAHDRLRRFKDEPASLNFLLKQRTEPIEAQAYGYTAAHKLKGNPDWKNLFRQGLGRRPINDKNAPYQLGDKYYHRFYKNAYQTMTKLAEP